MLLQFLFAVITISCDVRLAEIFSAWLCGRKERTHKNGRKRRLVYFSQGACQMPSISPWWCLFHLQLFRVATKMGLRPLARWDCGFEPRRWAWIFVACECCVLSGRSLCVGLITCLEESCRVLCVWVRSCSLENGEVLAYQGLLRHGGRGVSRSSCSC
jgi:hypothetical protein